MDGSCDQSHQWFFCLYLTLISVSTPFSPALIATGEYLSAHNWQASLRVLLKWCYTGPSTCNCVAAAQSWPLKGRAVIYLKWQQPHFLSAGGTTTKKIHPALLCIYFDSGGELGLFHVFACLVVRLPVVYCTVDQAPPDLSQPAVTTTLSYRGMDCALKALSQILSNVRLLLTWLISTNKDYTGSVAFNHFWGHSWAPAWALLHYINANAHKTFHCFIGCRSHLSRVGGVHCLSCLKTIIELLSVLSYGLLYFS